MGDKRPLGDIRPLVCLPWETFGGRAARTCAVGRSVGWGRYGTGVTDEMTTQEYRSFEVCGESAASGDMTMRSWYMPKASADRLAALVDDVHFSTRLPKHLIMSALVKVADRYRAEVEAEAQAAGRQRLERKELRIWADQLDALTKLRGALNQQRGGEGERITENTLIRVAIDMLLTDAGKLRGTTEDELRQSVTS